MTLDAHNAFSTVPKTNLLGLLGELGSPNIPKIKAFLEFKVADVASATGVPRSSMRFDRAIPPIVKQRMTEIATICELVAEHFDSIEKAAVWFKLSNPLLGGISPRDLIRLGRYKKLYKFVMDAIQGG